VTHAVNLQLGMGHNMVLFLRVIGDMQIWHSWAGAVAVTGVVFIYLFLF
jgi:hypothetical protein